MFYTSVKTIVPPEISLKIFADDIKIYARTARRHILQHTMQKFDEWCDSLDLKLSVEKCVVLHLGRRNAKHAYFINGLLVKKSESVENLGVTTTNSLKYSQHTYEIVKKAAKRSFFITRSFVIKDPEAYRRLFGTYVRGDCFKTQPFEIAITFFVAIARYPF